MVNTIDLYSDRGARLRSGVDLGAISPMRNAGIKEIVLGIKRTAAVSLSGIERTLASASIGGKGKQIPGRQMRLDIVKNAAKIQEKVADLVKVDSGDDTFVKTLNGGRELLVQVPSTRIHVAAEYVSSLTCTASAVTQSIINEFEVGMFEAPTVKSAVWGTYPQTLDLTGGNVSSFVGIPQWSEGFGYTLRNYLANYIVATCKSNTINSAALCSTLETVGVYESGDAIGKQERLRLLGYAYQGLNANNLVYRIAKSQGKTGTIGTVVHGIVEKAIADKVITPDEKFTSGYVTYKTDDLELWNAYCAAGTLAATLVNCGAMRASQGVTSAIVFFNDLIEKETSLPGCDFGKVQGTGVGLSFFTHSIYGGGSPGIFNGNHVVTRHSKGLVMPCVAAACAIDSGVAVYNIGKTAGLVGDVFSTIDEFREPIKTIAGAV